MPLQAGFAQADITPPVGTHKIGWLKDLVSDRVLDPLQATCAVLTNGDAGAGLIQLDTLCVRWTQVQDIRARISDQFGFPGQDVLVAATHNHAGPAVANVGDVPRDDAYVETMVAATVEAFGRALAGREDAEVGFGRAFDFEIAHNRRIVMRDGTVNTHGTYLRPSGPILASSMSVMKLVTPSTATCQRPGTNSRFIPPSMNSQMVPSTISIHSALLVNMNGSPGVP